MNKTPGVQSQSGATLTNWLVSRWNSFDEDSRVKCFVLLDVAPLSRAELQSAQIPIFTPGGALVATNIYGDLDGLDIAKFGPRLIEVGQNLYLLWPN